MLHLFLLLALILVPCSLWPLSETKDHVPPEPSHDTPSAQPSHDTASPEPPHDAATPEPLSILASSKPPEATLSPETSTDDDEGTDGYTCMTMPLKFSDFVFWLIKVGFVVGIPTLLILSLYFVVINIHLITQENQVSNAKYSFSNEMYFAGFAFGFIVLDLPIFSACLYVMGTFLWCLPFPWFILWPVLLLQKSTANEHTKVLFVLFVFQTHFSLPFSYAISWYILHMFRVCILIMSRGQATAPRTNQQQGRPITGGMDWSTVGQNNQERQRVINNREQSMTSLVQILQALDQHNRLINRRGQPVARETNQ